MRLHGGVRNFVGDKTRFFYVVGFGKALIGITEGVVIILFQIVRLVVVDKVPLGFHGLFRIKISRQEFVLHVD